LGTHSSFSTDAVSMGFAASGIAHTFTFAALEQLAVPPILQPFFSHSFRAAWVSLLPYRHCLQPFELPDAQM
jgi:hypothetical protein